MHREVFVNNNSEFLFPEAVLKRINLLKRLHVSGTVYFCVLIAITLACGIELLITVLLKPKP